MEDKIKELLASIVHPETGKDIVASGFIEHLAAIEGKVTVVLRFAKTRDPSRIVAMAFCEPRSWCLELSS